MDNNNFVRYNQVKTSDYRFEVYKDEGFFEFFDLETSPSWVANAPSVRDMTMRFGNEQTY